MSAVGNPDRGLHARAGHPMDVAAYDQYIGRWSRLFVPALLAAAEVSDGGQVLDVATGPGEAAHAALAIVGSSGSVVGADISALMVTAARARLTGPFQPVTADGQMLPFRAACFDAVFCQLGLMFFPDPARGLQEFRRVLRPGKRAAICVCSTADRAPMWGFFANALARRLPEYRRTFHLVFSLADAGRLHEMLRAAGFLDVSVTREERGGTITSLEAFWAPIEAGAGQLPQVYLALPEASRRAVRQEVNSHLARFDHDGRLAMQIEMLIATGRA